MGRKSRSRPMSFFASLPPELRRELRSQPSLESNNVTSGEGQEAAPQLSDLLPTQPPAQDGEAEGEGEDMDEDEDEDDDDDDKRAEDADMTEEAEANDSQIPPSTLPNGASSNTSAPARTAPPGASSSSTNTTTAVISRRHEYPPPPSSGRPAKRRRGEDPDPAASENPYLGHPWDCTGLVPRYMDRSEVPQNLQKYFFQRHSLWPAYSRLPLLMDDTGWFSVTPAAIASQIAERCACGVVVDAFCGVGGNAIAFAATCERVIAIDNCEKRLRLARHNALQCGVADRIEFVLADYTAWARARAGAAGKEAVDVVFLSPPWGGIEYQSGGGAYPLSAILPIPGDELFTLSAGLTPNIAYFLPRNVDIQEVAALAAHIPHPTADTVDGSERAREWVEIEEEWVGDKLKAVTAYFGSLVSGA